MKPILILCLGNEILSDDAFGFHVVRRLKDVDYEYKGDSDIIFAPLAGFNLLDYFADRKKILIVDVIVSGNVEPGTVRFFPMGNLTPSYNLVTSHQISLPTAIKLAESLGVAIPDNIDILAVEALDVQTLSEKMTPPVEDAVKEAIEYIKGWTILRGKEIRANESGKNEAAAG